MRTATLGLYVTFIGALECRRPPNYCRIEGTGDDAAIVFRVTWPLAEFQDALGWEKRLAWLDRNGWLSVERRGGEVWVRRGRKALAAAHRGEKAAKASA
jgi:hypothetical protein